MTTPPGPRAPRAWQTLAWQSRPGPLMERCRRRYGDWFTLKIAHEGTWVFTVDPDAVREVFTGDPDVLHAGEANVILRPVLGRKSVLLLDGDEHLAQRKMLLPPFHGERMRAYGELMAGIARREIARWPRGEAFPLLPRMQALTLEVVLRAVFGVREGAQLEHLRAVLRHMLEELARPRAFLTVALLGPERMERLRSFRNVMDPVDAALRAEIAARRRSPDLAERDDILSLLLQADGMDDDELRDELLTLLVAGHETTATALSWAIERMARHPGMLERAREPGYAEAAAQEALRLRPVLPIVLRKLKAPVTIAGRELPAGVTVAPCIYLLHRREDLYPDPYAYRPERFLDTKPGTYTWIPFGGGVRRCLGASFALFEMRTVLEVVAREADLRPDGAAPERVRRRAITLAPSRGARVVA